MDQIPCDVARDLMPLMAEGMASEDSEGLLKQHLSHCPACKAQYDSMGSASAGNIVEQAPLRSLKKALRKRSLRGAFIAVLAALLLLSVLFSIWTARAYVSFEQSGLMLTPSDDGSVLFLSFSNPWAEYRLDTYQVDEGQQMGEGSSADILVYTTPWSNHFKSGLPRTTVIPGDYQLWYLSGDGQEDQLIWPQEGVSIHGGRKTLPRLALVYYLGYAGLVFVVAAILWLVFRKKRGGKVFFALAAYAFSYGVGHLVVKGFSTVSYQMTRDFFWICLIALLLGTLVVCLREMFAKR